MPYYANAGEAFWSGANAGANMASKWISAYKYGDEYQSNEAFKKDAKAINDTYNEGMKGLDSITDPTARAQKKQELLTNRVEGLTASAAQHYGDRGAKIASQYIAGLDAGDQSVTNTLRRDQKEKAYAVNPDKYLDLESFSKIPRMGFTANVPGIDNQLVGAYMKALKQGDDEDVIASAAQFGLWNKDGLLSFDLDGVSGAAQMEGTTMGVRNVFDFAGAAYGWQ